MYQMPFSIALTDSTGGLDFRQENIQYKDVHLQIVKRLENKKTYHIGEEGITLSDMLIVSKMLRAGSENGQDYYGCEVGLRFNKKKGHLSLVAGKVSTATTTAQTVRFDEHSDDDSKPGDYRGLVHTHPTHRTDRDQLTKDLKNAGKMEIVITFAGEIFLYSEGKLHQQVSPHKGLSLDFQGVRLGLNDTLSLALFMQMDQALQKAKPLYNDGDDCYLEFL